MLENKKTKSKFDFKENIKKLSVSKNDEELIDEWEFISEEKHSDNSLKCICNKNISQVFYYFNKINGNYINVESKCRDALGLSKEKTTNVIKQTLINFIIGKYTNIYDFLECSTEYRIKIFEFLNKMIDDKNNFEMLIEYIEMIISITNGIGNKNTSFKLFNDLHEKILIKILNIKSKEIIKESDDIIQLKSHCGDVKNVMNYIPINSQIYVSYKNLRDELESKISEINFLNNQMTSIKNTNDESNLQIIIENITMTNNKNSLYKKVLDEAENKLIYVKNLDEKKIKNIENNKSSTFTKQKEQDQIYRAYDIAYKKSLK